METNVFIDNVILTATVVAALLSSIANIAISIINNNRLKKIEKNKQLNEFDKYRFDMLYQLVLNWYNYDSEDQGDNNDEIMINRYFFLFTDSSKRYELAKPLLDKKFVEQLEPRYNEGNNILTDMLNSDNTANDNLIALKIQLVRVGQEFSGLLRNAVYSQLEILLNKTTK